MEQGIGTEQIHQPVDPHLLNNAKQEIARTVENPTEHLAADIGSLGFVSFIEKLHKATEPDIRTQLEITVRDAKIAETLALAYAPLLKRKLGKAPDLAKDVSGTVWKAPDEEHDYIIVTTSKTKPFVKERIYDARKQKGANSFQAGKEALRSFLFKGDKISAAQLEGAGFFESVSLAILGGTQEDVLDDTLGTISKKLGAGWFVKQFALRTGRYIAKKLTGPNLYPDVPERVKKLTSVASFFFPDTWLTVPLWQLMANRIKSVKTQSHLVTTAKPLVAAYVHARLDAMRATDGTNPAGKKNAVIGLIENSLLIPAKAKRLFLDPIPSMDQRRLDATEKFLETERSIAREHEQEIVSTAEKLTDTLEIGEKSV